MLLSVIFSFRNEQEVLPELIRRICETLDSSGLEYELIFVNDASTDSSLELLMKYREQDQRIKIINMSRRFGVGPCIMAGLRHSKGDAVVYMDADLQDPPELIPKMLAEYEKGADVVNTTRTRRKGENALKMWLTRTAYRLINSVADIDIPKNCGDFKLLSRRAVDQLIRLNEYDPFMRGLVRWIGLRQVQVFYEREPRFSGETHCSLIRSLSPVKEFIRGLTSFSELPLYFALIVGFLVLGGAFVYLVKIVFTKGFLGVHRPEGSAVMIATLFLGGTILFAIGILGMYIGKIHHEIKRRPPYIIESKVGIDECAQSDKQRNS